MVNQWLVLIKVILGTPELQTAVHKLSVLVEAADEVSTRLRTQVYNHLNIPDALICLVQTEFNDSFHQVFVIPLLAHWPQFVLLVKTLNMIHLRKNALHMPGSFI